MADSHYPRKSASTEEAAQSAATLIGHLQEVTETLAATSSEEDVFRVILQPALEALGAEAGTVLLLEAGHIRAVAAAGQEDVVSLWQNGPLSMDTPTADAIKRLSPLFFGHSDELLAAYPALEKRTGGRATVANAVLPLVLEGRALGVVVLDFVQAHDFLEVERRFLRVLCAQCAIALGRIRQLQEQEQLVLERTAALSAFAALTEAVGNETDLRVLALRAVDVLQKYLPELSVGYRELEQGRWESRVQSDNIPPEVATVARAGYAFDMPIFLQAVQARTCTFTDGFDAVEAGFPHAQSYGAVAIYPYFQGGKPSSILAVATQQTRRWTDADRAMISAVGRSLGLAIEHAEQTRQLTRQRDLLTAANVDMEAFAYSVSHDLRTPVRHIKGFSDLLTKALHGRLDERTERYLQMVSEGADRMNTLIDAMLDLARSSAAPLQLGPVDLEALVAAVRMDLEGETLNRQVTWRVAPLPPVIGDRETLRQVLTNLIENALKYTRNQPEASIEIWAEDQEEQWTVSVRDNGAGFDPKYQDRLFGVFQRLHSDREFEGTGVGLATVKRIVMKHEGQVFAEGQPGAGATFGFTLPKRHLG